MNQPGNMATNHLGETPRSAQQELLSEAVQQAKEASANISRQASQKVVEAKAEVRKQVENQKGEVVTQINGVNQALRQTAAQMENHTLGDQMVRLADQVERAAEKLEQAEIEQVVHAAEDFSRSQPALFLSISFAAGVALARFLRASTPQPPLQLLANNPRLPAMRPGDPVRGIDSDVSLARH